MTSLIYADFKVGTRRAFTLDHKEMTNMNMQTPTPGTPEALNALLEQIAAGTAPGSADPAAAAQQDEDEAAAQGQAGDYAAQRWYEQTAAAYRAVASQAALAPS
jgi:hypothetical protein